MIDRPWYRALATFSQLVWLNVLTVLASGTVVLIPAALSTAYAVAGRLVRTGETTSTVEYARLFTARVRPATCTGLPVLALVPAAVMIIRTAPSPVLAGVSVALLVVAMFILLGGAAALADQPDHRWRPGAAWTNLLRSLVVRPLRALVILVPWLIMAPLLAFVPVGFVLPLWCVAISLPVYLGALLTRRDPEARSIRSESGRGHSMTPKKPRSLRRRVAAALATTSLILLAACGNGGSGAPEERPTVVIWDNSYAGSDVAEKYIVAWGERNGVDVKVEHQVGNEYPQTLQLALQTGKGPDVFRGNQTGKLIAAGYVAPVDDLLDDVERAAYGDALEPPAALIHAGKLYGLPTEIVTTRLAYNRDLFKAAGLDPDRSPRTLAELRDACAALARTKVACIGAPLKWNGFPTWYLDRIVSAANPDVTIQGPFLMSTGRYDMTLYEPVVEFFREAVQQEWVFPGPSSVDNSIIRSEFAQGDVAMIISASWDVAELNDKLATKIDWAVGDLPVPDGQSFVRNNGSVTGAWVRNAASDSPEAAGKVLQALAGPELNTELAKLGAIPIRSDVNPPERDDQLQGFLPAKTDTTDLASPVGELAVQGETYSDVLVALILGSQPIRPALDELNTRYNEALDAAVKDQTIKLEDYTR